VLTLSARPHSQSRRCVKVLDYQALRFRLNAMQFLSYKFWRNKPWIFFAILIAGSGFFAFGLVPDKIVDGRISAFDAYIMRAFRTGADRSSLLLGPPWFQEMARDITALGSFSIVGIVLFGVAGYFLLVGKRATAVLMLVAVIGGGALNSLLKLVFVRPRPDIFSPVARVFTASFPSGHAALSAITYITLGVLLARTTPSRNLRIFFVGISIALTILIGVSRVYLGVHYPTDVLAGWCVGLFWAVGCWKAMTWLQRAKKIESPSPPEAAA
jgi:undecaprenyl-diphosphatase